MRSIEKMLIAMDRFPLSAFYRIAIGFACIPVISLLRLDANSAWTLLLVLLAILLSLRLFPAVIRKVLPFSREAKELWTERRRVAKRYDSYQWQKLFFIGLGLAIYVGASGELLPSRIAVSALCLACGAIGQVRWRQHRPIVKKSLAHQGAI